MNTRSTFPIFAWLLAIFAMAIVAISPMIVFGYNEIAFKIVPALQAVNAFAFGH